MQPYEGLLMRSYEGWAWRVMTYANFTSSLSPSISLPLVIMRLTNSENYITRGTSKCISSLFTLLCVQCVPHYYANDIKIDIWQTMNA